MKYTGNSCKGCGLPFNEDDDIVVCPECGTPQHRECYDKENKCVCSHLHGEDYAWQGVVIRESPLPEEKKETVSCPNCGYENPKGTPVCKQCGMKFTIFGMNVVDAMHEQDKRTSNPNRDIPDYEAPFTLGTGAGFDENEGPQGTPSADEVQKLITDVLTGNAENTAGPDIRLNLGGPFPAEDEINGVMTNTVGNFIGSNAMSYISKFKKMQKGKKLTFNFAAFFFGPYWFFYRKLYKAGIVVMTAMLAMSIIVTPYLYDIMAIYEKFIPAVQSGTMTEAQFTEMYGEFVAVTVPITVYFFASLLLQLICGFVANHLYKKHVIAHAGNAERMKTKAEAMGYIVKYGGASILIAFAAYFANQLLTMLVSSML